MIEVKRLRGRPLKYKTDLEKIETRRLQNRINQRRFKRKQKLKIELSKVTCGEEFNTQYRKEILNYFNRFEYDYFFTGTFDNNRGGREYLKSLLEYLDLGHQYDDWLSKMVKPKTIGINGMRDYISRYLDFLSSKNIFKRCFFVIEKGEKSNYHVHMLFKSNVNVKDLGNRTVKTWLLGYSKCRPIENNEDKSKIIEYCIKEFKPSSRLKSDQNIVDNWSFDGDFKPPRSYKYQNVPSSLKKIETCRELVY